LIGLVFRVREHIRQAVVGQLLFRETNRVLRDAGVLGAVREQEIEGYASSDKEGGRDEFAQGRGSFRFI